MMDEKRELKKRIEASNFAENNGAMIRFINILDGDWIRLATIKTALPEFSEAEFWDSLTYLQKEGYIDILYCSAQQLIDARRADPKKCDVSLTAKGIRLARYIDTDPAVLV